MNELKEKSLIEIGQLYINWLNSHRNSYLYHKTYLDMICKQVSNEYDNDVEVLDEEPPDYSNTTWQEYQHKFSQESQKAMKLYQELISKADEYIIQQNLENLK